jgi:hypothetical protein
MGSMGVMIINDLHLLIFYVCISTWALMVYMPFYGCSSMSIIFGWKMITYIRSEMVRRNMNTALFRTTTTSGSYPRTTTCPETR